MRPAKVLAIKSTSDCVGHLGSGKASTSLAKSILYSSTPPSFRLVICVQCVIACSHACKLLAFQGLSKFLVGTVQRKKISPGLLATAKRKRRMRALGK